LRFARDERGYEYTSLLHPVRRYGRTETQLLYCYRTPPYIKVGRPALDEEARALLERQFPDIPFDWDKILREPPQTLTEQEAARRKEQRDARDARRRRKRPIETVENAETMGGAGTVGPAQLKGVGLPHSEEQPELPQNGSLTAEAISEEAEEGDQDSGDEGDVLTNDQTTEASAAPDDAGPAAAKRRRRRRRRRRRGGGEPSSNPPAGTPPNGSV
jgi:hypothetical protein